MTKNLFFLLFFSHRSIYVNEPGIECSGRRLIGLSNINTQKTHQINLHYLYQKRIFVDGISVHRYLWTYNRTPRQKDFWMADRLKIYESCLECYTASQYSSILDPPMIFHNFYIKAGFIINTRLYSETFSETNRAP